MAEAAGRVLREPARALVDLPPFPSSAMDGFARPRRRRSRRAADRVSSRCGSPPPGPLPDGLRCGASRPAGRCPDGADAVVPVELVEDRGTHVAIAGRASARPARPTARRRRPRGRRRRRGRVRISDPRRSVHSRRPESPRSRAPCRATCRGARDGQRASRGRRDARGRVRSTSRIARWSPPCSSAAGADVEVLPVVADDEAAHREAIARGLEADVLVTSGGVSMGEHDLVRRVASELGVREIFWGVAVKPGKPLSFGVRDETLVFGLPGNPVSSLVGALVFVATGLRALQGATTPLPRYASRSRLVRAPPQCAARRVRAGGARRPTVATCSSRPSPGRSRT